ncbi:hypothetical protein DFJ58DRAFT_917808, partial [Suillus subalutaceus]|uniref:uncharacterized protein n=1 Tax=Suillus subalutaceus TaxID=48586 RepID=UPI001B880ED9
MQTDYSADDITAATSLQFFAACPDEFSSAVKLPYPDLRLYLFVSRRGNWRFLLVSHWTTVKGLYIVTRYVPFLLLAINLYLSLIPNETPGKCRVLDNINTGFGILSVVCSEAYFALRTCALWNNDRILLTAVLSTFLVSSQSTHHTKASGKCISQTFIGASMGIAFTTTAPAAYAVSAIPGITGCYQSSTNFRLFIPFILLSAFELGLMTLTLIRAIQNWRTNPGRLYVVLVQHNIFYYTCGFLLSVANIFTSLLLHYSYHGILDDFQFVILAILATHMHRHLWQMKRQTCRSDASMQIPLSEMTPV